MDMTDSMDVFNPVIVTDITIRLTDRQVKQVANAVASGRKIEAIKCLNHQFQLGLKGAKELAEYIHENHYEDMSHRAGVDGLEAYG